MLRCISAYRFRVGLLTLALFFAGSIATAETSNKWRIEVSGAAESDGSIIVSLANIGAVMATVSVAIVKDTRENDVARRIRDELLLQLPKNRFTVEIDDGEDVLIKKRRRSTPDFEVRIDQNTVQGVRVKPDRE